MHKVTLTRLYEDVFARSTLVAIPNLERLLTVKNAKFSPWEVFFSIVKDALNKFEYYYMLVRSQKVYIEVDAISRRASYADNWEAYMKGMIDEYSITLPMASCNGLAYSSYVDSMYPLRNFRYENGEFSNFWYSTGVYWANCNCHRPLVADYIRDEHASGKYPTDKCAVYFMREGLDSTWNIFRDEVYLQTCRYLMGIKKNFPLANLPIELFNGIEEDFNRMQSDQTQIYQQALKAAAWIH